MKEGYIMDYQFGLGIYKGETEITINGKTTLFYTVQYLNSTLEECYKEEDFKKRNIRNILTKQQVLTALLNKDKEKMSRVRKKKINEVLEKMDILEYIRLYKYLHNKRNEATGYSIIKIYLWLEKRILSEISLVLQKSEEEAQNLLEGQTSLIYKIYGKRI